jgi:hypothetical protein
MAKEMTAQSDIPATPGRVWEVLTDLAAYRRGTRSSCAPEGSPTTG